MSAASHRRKKALIIDDETDICYLLGNILMQQNIQPVFAGSLSETDRVLQSAENFGYIFLDNHLPDGRGISYVEKLKKKFPDTPVIMITAHDSSSDREKAISTGVDHFIGKPFTREIIINTVKNNLGSQACVNSSSFSG